MENISFDELKRHYDDLSDNYSILQEKFGNEMKRNETLHSDLSLVISQYNAVVKQNCQLQKDLNSKQKELNELEKKPFFPYALNSGNNADFGEFILISHAWFTISNIPFQLGIVEVEWKSSGVRKMYLGAGSTNGKSFKQDVLSIALHGQKIKDSAEV